MGKWVIETKGWQQILTHYCEHVGHNERNDILNQDIGGGYVRCSRCEDKFLPASEPGNPRLMLRIKPIE